MAHTFAMSLDLLVFAVAVLLHVRIADYVVSLAMIARLHMSSDVSSEA